MRVLLIIHEDATRTELGNLIRRTTGLQLAGEYSAGDAALHPRGPVALKPRLALVDSDLPGMRATDCVRALKRLVPGVRVLLLVSNKEDPLLLSYLAAGASGWLPKDSKPDTIVTALAELDRDGVPLRPEAAEVAARCFQRLSFEEPFTLPLTPREREVLVLYACGYQSKKIADNLSMAQETVHSHLRSGRAKLGAAGREEVAERLFRGT